MKTKHAAGENRQQALACLTAGMFLLAGVLHAASTLARGRPVRAANDRVLCEAVDLGPVDQGEEVPFVFRVRNPTQASIAVVELRPSCGCTWLDDVSGDRIEPGSELAIRGVLDTRDRRGLMQSNAVLTYKVSSSARENQAILTVRAEVRSAVRVTPEVLELAVDPTANEVAIATLVFDSDRLTEFQLIDAVPTASWIHAEIVDREFRGDADAGLVATVQVTVDPRLSAADGGFLYSKDYAIRIRTTAESAQDFLVPVRIRRPMQGNMP